jgi:hypothetical protein
LWDGQEDVDSSGSSASEEADHVGEKQKHVSSSVSYIENTLSGGQRDKDSGSSASEEEEAGDVVGQAQEGGRKQIIEKRRQLRQLEALMEAVRLVAHAGFRV